MRHKDNSLSRYMVSDSVSVLKRKPSTVEFLKIGSLKSQSRVFFSWNLQVQCNLDLVTLNLVTTCDLVTIFQRPFFNLLYKIIRFSDIMRFSDRFCRDQKCH